MNHRFDPAVLANDPEHRSALLDVLDGALDAVDPAAAVARTLRRTPDGIEAGDRSIPVPRGRTIVLALGKAAGPMAGAAVHALDGVPVTGVVAGPAQIDIPPLLSVVGSHPVPGPGSVAAGSALLDAARDAGPGDLVICLVSGGGSAIAEVPAPGIRIDDIAATTDGLLRAGAPIEDLNTVRRSLSMLKDGGLARAAGDARVVSLIVSDVVGNPLHSIAGGPTSAGPTSPVDAAAVLDRWQIRVPPVVNRYLAGAPPPPPAQGRDDISLVIADGAAAARGAADRAERHDIDASLIDRPVEGEASDVGVALASRIPIRPSMIVGWGETTVTVTGSGSGGRNQEVAVAAAPGLEVMDGVLVCSLGTDGIDGPTDAAGGIADAGTVARGEAAGMSAESALADNDTRPYLEATGDILRCGPTGTNVGDLFIVWRWA